ncbi:MAG: transporter substrate-binding domain-containing protein [Pseudobdellovibrionaceae bacterium]|nr:transporter substrate-binding domain-containing protein [Pseudobdellovibrionaceae bacterium]
MTLTLEWLTGTMPLHGAEAFRPLRVGWFGYDPLVIYKEAEPGGPLFDYAKRILEHAGMTPQYHEVSIKRSLEELRNKRLDMVLTLFKTPERESFVHFSERPLLSVGSGFCARFDIRKKPLKVSSRLAHVSGTVIPVALKGMVQLPVSGNDAQIRMLQLMQTGRVDLIYNPKPEILIVAARLAHISIKLHCYELKNSKMPIYFGFSRDLPIEITQRIEESLKKALQKESFDQYLKKRWAKAGIAYPSVSLIGPSHLPARP